MLIFNLYQVYTRLATKLGTKSSFFNYLFFKYDKIKEVPLYKVVLSLIGNCPCCPIIPLPKLTMK